MFVFETVFISEQMAKYGCGVLLEISDKCNSGLKQFGKFHNHTV